MESWLVRHAAVLQTGGLAQLAGPSQILEHWSESPQRVDSYLKPSLDTDSKSTFTHGDK